MAKRRGSRASQGSRRRSSQSSGTKPRRSNLPGKIRDTEKSVAQLGEKQVARKLRIGSSRWLTPTKAGWKALDDVLLELQKHSRKGKRAAWTFDLKVRYRGPDGKMVDPRTLAGAGFPRMRDVRAMRRSVERRRKKKFRSDAEAFRYMGTTNVIAAVNRQIEGTKTLQGGTDELLASLEGKSSREVRRAWREFKSTRSLSFKLTVHRIVTPKRAK